nr:methyl-accepting chemotaxis protein [Actinomycetota bacterium]
MNVKRKGTILLGALFAVLAVGEGTTIAMAAQSAGAVGTYKSQYHILNVAVQHMQRDFYNYDDQMNMYVLVAAMESQHKNLAATTYGQAVSAYHSFQADLATTQRLASLSGTGNLAADAQRINSDILSYTNFANQIHAAVQAGNIKQAAYIQTLGNIQPSNDIMPALAIANTDAVKAASAHLDAIAASQRSLMAIAIAVAIAVLGITIAVAVGGLRWVMRPVEMLRSRMHEIAEGDGDLTQRVELSRDDEFGHLAGSFNKFVSNMSGVIGNVAANAQSLSASSEELSATSSQLSSTAEETAAQASTASSAAEEINANVNSMAEGSDQMRAAIGEVARSAAEAARVASSAVSQAEQTTATVAKLGDSSAEVGEVVKVITSIAEQTNLLA